MAAKERCYTWGAFSHPNQVIREATNILSTFKRLTTTPADGNEITNVHRPVVWQAPPSGFYKASWDVAVDIKHGKMGFGAIISDYKGQVVAGYNRTQESVVDPIMAKAWAGMVAATLCKDT
jgi:hypothetical protein